MRWIARDGNRHLGLRELSRLTRAYCFHRVTVFIPLAVAQEPLSTSQDCIARQYKTFDSMAKRVHAVMSLCGGSGHERLRSNEPSRMMNW